MKDGKITPINPGSGEQEPTMSSVEIAQLCEKRHNNVMRDIKITLEEAGIGVLKFERTYIDSQNKSRPCYILPRREVDLIITGYSPKYRLAIIDRWRELEAEKQSFQIPTTLPEALRFAAIQEEKIEEQKIALLEAAPKVEFHDRVTSSNTLCGIAEAAQLAKLPYGQNNLFRKLREKGVLISGGKRHNLPKQQFVEQGLFVVTEYEYVDSEKETQIRFTTKVTQKGLAWIIKHFGEEDAA